MSPQYLFRAKYNYCIYGIKYYHNKTGFDDILYFNDPNYPWSQRDITYQELEKVARPFCNDLHTYTEQDAEHKTLYYAAWIMTTANTYSDIFLLCCDPCPEAETVEEWRINLKLQFLIRHQYNLVKSYELREVPEYTDRIQFYIDESYHINERTPEINSFMKTCNGRNFKKVPITTNNNVCFITATDTFHRYSLYERQATETPNRMAHELIHLGPYTAGEMKYMTELECRIQRTSHKDNECVVWMTYDAYGYDCCCYGDLIEDCQDRISSSILVGTEQLTASKKFMACAISNRNRTSLSHLQFCPLYVEISRMQYKYYMSTSEFRAGKSDHNALNSGIDIVGCNRYANWDIRLTDIVNTRCVQLLPLMDMCLKTYPLTTDHFEALCCCNHQTFCNYNGLILSKLEANNALYYCKYNSQYQYLFNDLLIIDKPPSRSCLLHYIDNATLLDMDLRLPNSDFVLFQQPGSAFYPIDFSYALLEDGKCHYVEVEVNTNHTNIGSCREAAMFQTKYMPLKIFACRCRTEVGARTPCDEKLARKIKRLARISPLTNLTQCMRYGQQTLQGITGGEKRVFLTYTSYCYTEMTLQKNGNDMEFYVSGGEVTHTMANSVGKYLNHIAYAMWLETGSTSSLCSSIRKGQAYCFCRLYSNYANNACNEDVRERMKLQQILMKQECDFKMRKQYPNRLSNYLVLKGETWCHSPDIYGTLDIDNDRIFCNEIKALEDECLARVEDREDLRLQCCCKRKCERVGFIIQTLAMEISNSLDY
ncbi:unnamed protein product [Litomosoides sigmodontis]|uniref:Uncharacterized protein n=1 Tax=Litomosoides sigmodontis TaxID=42156 RepID=A0A3P6U000_LITSI|nr:unnamed protein product [Litomosoides sigmodontis]